MYSWECFGDRTCWLLYLFELLFLILDYILMCGSSQESMNLETIYLPHDDKKIQKNLLPKVYHTTARVFGYEDDLARLAFTVDFSGYQLLRKDVEIEDPSQIQVIEYDVPQTSLVRRNNKNKNIFRRALSWFRKKIRST